MIMIIIIKISVLVNIFFVVIGVRVGGFVLYEEWEMICFVFVCVNIMLEKDEFKFKYFDEMELIL